jgi:TetR/AcrR family transcriptional regulator of autoinduction and epiphytic fitness
METTASAPEDGRAARATRTRTTIVDALLELLEEGDLQPTAHRIAERAGISIRLIYHHFGDMEALFRAVVERQGERMLARARPVSPDLPFDERADLFVEQRARMLEWITPVRRASLLQEPFSEELTAARDLLFRVGEDNVAHVFARELGRFDPDEGAVVLAAASCACSWNAWDALRISGRSEAQARAAMRRSLSALLGS